MKKLVLILTPIALCIGLFAGYTLASKLYHKEAAEESTATTVQPVIEKRVQTKYDIGPPTANELLEMVNAERKKVNVKPLIVDANVQKSAQLKSDDMANRDYYSHIVKGTKYTLTDEMAYYINLTCVSSSENINADVYSTQSAMAKWIVSKPHFKAMKDPRYTKTGFGISKDKDGEYYVVQHFCIER